MTKKEDEETPPSNPEDLKNFVDETARLHLSDNDLEILEKHLANPKEPNEALKQAAQRYSDEVRDKHVHINDFDTEREKRGELLAEIMKNDEELGLYNEPFDNSMDKEDISDWDVTLMDGLEDEEPFFTDEEVEKILQEEPTEEEIQRNFSTIEPETENIFQNDEISIPNLESIVNQEPITVSNKKSVTIEQHKKNGYKVNQIPEDEERMNIIGQNGNEGLHYDNEEDTSLEKNDEKKN